MNLLIFIYMLACLFYSVQRIIPEKVNKNFKQFPRIYMWEWVLVLVLAIVAPVIMCWELGKQHGKL